MIKALENPHFKKIREEINWKVRHAEAKSLEEALKMEACGSGAFCVGMHLFKIHGKEVVVKTENGDKYFVNKNTISVEI